MPANPLIYILILNWNGATDTLRCIDSLKHLTGPPFHLIVIDNGSTDGSEALFRDSGHPMTLLQTGKNLGYAGGNNVGIEHALKQGADLILLLNNDTLLTPLFSKS